ncbi:hypothetical protein M8J77_004644 [Diaphorina citri]|nr:hypothetical protein M8J77_004644 [Diaphorina citri]
MKQGLLFLKNFANLPCKNGFIRIVIPDLPLKQCTQCPGQDSVEHLEAVGFEMNGEMVDLSRGLKSDGLEEEWDDDIKKSATEGKQTQRDTRGPRRHKKEYISSINKGARSATPCTTPRSPRERAARPYTQPRVANTRSPRGVEGGEAPLPSMKCESISSTSTVSASSISDLATGLSFASISSAASESSSPSSTITSNTSHIASASSTSQAISSPSSASGVVDLTYSSNSLTPASANSSSTPPPRNTASSASSEISTSSLAPSSSISTATSENNSTLTSASSTLTSSKTSVSSAVTNTNQKPPPPTPPLNSTGVNKMGESNEGILESPVSHVPSQAGNSDILKIFQIQKPYLEMNKKPFGVPLLITASKINLIPNEPMEIFVRRCVPVVPCYCPCY